MEDIWKGKAETFENTEKLSPDVKPNDKCCVCGCTASEIDNHNMFISWFSGVMLKVNDGTKRGSRLCTSCLGIVVQELGLDVLTLTNPNKVFSVKKLRSMYFKRAKQQIRDDVRYRRAVTFFNKAFEDKLLKIAHERYEHGILASKDDVEDIISELNDNWGFKDEYHICFIGSYRCLDINDSEARELFDHQSIIRAKEHALEVQSKYPKQRVTPIAIHVRVHQCADDGYEANLIKHDRLVSDICLSNSGVLTVVSDGDNKVEIVEKPIRIENRGGKFTIN